MTAIDYVALAPIGIYWLSLDGAVVFSAEDETVYPSPDEVRAILERL